MKEQEKCPIIFLDMDGVLADFMQAALRLHFADKWRERLDAWPIGKYDFSAKHLGLPVDQFWAKIDAAPGFWEHLPTYPWTDDLIEMCREYGRICVLSAPSRKPGCIQGKLRWIQKVFGERFRDYVFAPRQHKQLLAAPDRYLIEDSEQNADEFVAAGGSGAIIIPQPWNRQPATSVDTVDTVRRKLESLLCRVR